MSTAPIPVVLDCDPGHDDAFAILLAVAEPRLDLLAITTVSGNGTLDRVTDNARRVCTLAGVAVPIAAGAGAPLARPAAAAPSIHGASGLDGPSLPAPTVPLDVRSADALLVDVIAASSVPVTLIATGPLTNIAVLVRDHPDICPHIARISFMGGSTHRGNWTPAAEFNVWADPEATEVVLRSGVPLTMSGLNVTHQALATATVRARFTALGTALGATCAAWLDYFAGTYRDVFAMPDPPVHDPVAVALVAEPAVGRVRVANVEVEVASELTRGATIVDLDGITGRAANTDVAVGLDVERFWDLLVGAVERLGRAGTAP